MISSLYLEYSKSAVSNSVLNTRIENLFIGLIGLSLFAHTRNSVSVLGPIMN